MIELLAVASRDPAVAWVLLAVGFLAALTLGGAVAGLIQWCIWRCK